AGGRPEQHDGRPGVVQYGLQPLRRGARQRPAADRRQVQGGRRRGGVNRGTTNHTNNTNKDKKSRIGEKAGRSLRPREQRATITSPLLFCLPFFIRVICVIRGFSSTPLSRASGS